MEVGNGFFKHWQLNRLVLEIGGGREGGKEGECGKNAIKEGRKGGVEPRPSKVLGYLLVLACLVEVGFFGMRECVRARYLGTTWCLYCIFTGSIHTYAGRKMQLLGGVVSPPRIFTVCHWGFGLASSSCPLRSIPLQSLLQLHGYFFPSFFFSLLLLFFFFSFCCACLVLSMSHDRRRGGNAGS